MRAHLVPWFIIWPDYCPDERQSEFLSASDPLLLSKVRLSKTEGKGVLAQDPFDVRLFWTEGCHLRIYSMQVTAEISF